MNDTNDSECLPPPLPLASVEIPPVAPVRCVKHFRAWPWLLLAATGAAAGVDAAFWTDAGVQYGFGGYGAALATALGAGALLALRRDLDWRHPVWALIAATAVASAWVGSGISVMLVPALLIALVRKSSAEGDSAGAPWVFRGPALWIGALSASVGAGLGKVFRGRSAAWAAAGVTGAFFLMLLAFGNAALAKYLDGAARALSEIIRIQPEDIARLVFWGVGILGFGLLAAPRPVAKPAGVLVPVPAKPAPVVFSLLIGANLAFLASNLTDTYWLGLMRTAPEGVSTTAYLYDGAYVLMLDAAVAGALLLKLFSADGAARGDVRAKILGHVLVLQCAWLGLGVAGRLALQMDKYGFTPVRLWGVVFLAWGFTGLWGVWRHLRKTPSFRSFVRLAVWSALGILCVLQFRPPAVLSVDLNLACYQNHPEWRFDDAYLFRTDLEGFRLSRDILKSESDSPRGKIERERYENWRVRFEGGSGYEWDSGGARYFDWRVRSLRHDALCEDWQSHSTSP